MTREEVHDRSITTKEMVLQSSAFPMTQSSKTFVRVSPA